jgi:aminopeptidase N
MTSVEGAGIIGGGMEFPQMTIIGDYNAAGDSALYNVIAHELAHMWVPMIVSINERRYSWFDEGTTSFNENQSRKEFFPGERADDGDRDNYLRIAGSEAEGEIMRRSDYHYPGPAYGIASYSKPATVLVALRELLGEETFNRAYHEFFDRWQFRHAYPWDLWNTFESVSGQDLDWFWYSWYHTTWTLDQAVASVDASESGATRIVIEDRGRIPMPARVRITRADGSTLDREVPVETWLGGATSATIHVPAGAAVTRVEIDPSGNFPDVARQNNVWTR